MKAYIQKLSLFLSIFLLSFAVTSCSPMASKGKPLTEEEKQSIIEDSIKHKDFQQLFRQAAGIGSEPVGTFGSGEADFIDIFRNYKKFSNTRDVSHPVTEYIKACCADKAAALKLLGENNFSIGNNIVNTRDYRRKGYSEVYYAERMAHPFLPAFYTHTTYEVTLFIKGDSVVHVNAAVGSVSL